MLAEMMSKELVALDMSDFEEANDLIEVMAGGCGVIACGGAVMCGGCK